MARQISIKVAALGLGLGGANFAQAIKAKFGGTIGFVNLSQQDLDTANIENKEDAILLKGINAAGVEGSGAGKDRTEGGRYFGSNVDRIGQLAYKISADAEILFVCASTSGGTGSGLIPRTLAYLSTDEYLQPFVESGKKPPIVFAVALTPDFDEGVKSLTNTLDCLNEFRQMSAGDKKIGRFLIITNEFGKNESTTAAKYTRINEGAIAYLARYFEQFGSSREGVLDRADRFATLRTPGIHSFFSFDRNGRHETPFIQPEGARVMAAAAEIPEGELLESHIERWGLAIDDAIKGFFSPDESKMGSIVHLAGFNNWGKLTERFKNQLDLKKSRAADTQSTNKTQGIGLRDIAAQKEFVKKEYTAGTIGSIDDIDALFKD